MGRKTCRRTGRGRPQVIPLTRPRHTARFCPVGHYPRGRFIARMLPIPLHQRNARLTTNTPITTEHRIDLEPGYRNDPRHGRSTGHETAIMSYAGEVIGVSKQPIYDAARFLLNAGLARATDRIATFRGDTRCLHGGVGVAAQLSVVEEETGLKVVRQRPFAGSQTRTAA